MEPKRSEKPDVEAYSLFKLGKNSHENLSVFMLAFNWIFGILIKYVLGSKLPLFPYSRGWETQPNSRGLYTHYKDSY